MQGVILWFTGLPCSGKSSLAQVVQSRLKDMNRQVEILDGDVVRTNLSKGLGFSREDRETNLRRIGFVCNLLARNGVIAIAAAISPFRNISHELRQVNGDLFIEVWTNASLEECTRRDVKGMYKKAIAGELKHFTGIDDPYESPDNPDLVCHTDNESIEESTNKILDLLRTRGII